MKTILLDTSIDYTNWDINEAGSIKMIDISELKGKTITKIVKSDDNEQLQFHVGNDVYYMFHDQDYCETVSIEEIIGNLDDIIGSPILEAECATNDAPAKDDWDDLCLWTFYKIGTIKGHVNIRWYGSSNGYYGVEVSFQKNTMAWCYDD